MPILSTFLALSWHWLHYHPDQVEAPGDYFVGTAFRRRRGVKRGLLLLPRWAIVGGFVYDVDRAITPRRYGGG